MGFLTIRSIVPPASVFPYAGATAPDGWLLCDGSAVSRTTYAALFAAIGTTYGSGNGSTTFNLPNAQGVFLRGAGSQTINNASTGNVAITYTATRGTTQGDQFQGSKQGVSDPGHGHSASVAANVNGFLGGATTYTTTGGAPQNGSIAVSVTDSATGITTTGPISDGTNGTPRIGSETRPSNIVVNYIIKT